MEQLIKKAKKYIENNCGVGTYAILSQKEPDGTLTSSPITAAMVNGLKEVYFGTGLGSNKVARINNDPSASVCFPSEDGYVTLNGKLEVIMDTDVKRSVWYEGLENHFTGPADPAFCVLKLSVKAYKLMIDWEEVRGEINAD